MITFLTVLKYIGIVLLWILAIALVLLALVLFVPIRYEAVGATNDKTEREKLDFNAIKETAEISFKFSWFFRLIRGGIDYPDSPEFSLYVLCFRIPLGKKEGKEKKKEDKDTKKKKKEGPLSERIASFIDGLYDKIEQQADTAARYLRFLNAGATQKAAGAAINTILKVISHILPGKWEIKGTVGRGDPAATAEIYEVLGITYPITAGHVYIQPSYMSCILDLSGYAKGRIRLISLLIIVLRLIFDRNVRITIKRFKKLRAKAQKTRSKGRE